MAAIAAMTAIACRAAIAIPDICHFLYTGRIFNYKILHPKIPKNTQKYPKNSKIYSVSRSIWKILHLTELFYTGTARGARDKYQVCFFILSILAVLAILALLALLAL